MPKPFAPRRKITGKKSITGVDMRKGLEALDLTADALKIGLEGFTNPIQVTCKDHAGAHPIYIQQWDGKAWQGRSDWIDADDRPRAAEA